MMHERSHARMIAHDPHTYSWESYPYVTILLPQVLIEGHAGHGASALAMNRTRRVYATGGDNNCVILWSADERKAVARMQLPRDPKSASFCAVPFNVVDGEFKTTDTLACGLANGVICFINFALTVVRLAGGFPTLPCLPTLIWSYRLSRRRKPSLRVQNPVSAVPGPVLNLAAPCRV